MNTIRTLDHYRMALTDDRVATLLLSLLAKGGAQTEDDLLKQVNIPSHESSQKIGLLYQANFIHHSLEHRWNVTPIGLRTLAKLGFLEAINQFYIHQQSLEDKDKRFLIALVSQQSDKDIGDELRTSFLKSATHIAYEYKLTKDTLRRYLYATLFSSFDDAASNLHSRDYCSALNDSLLHIKELSDADTLYSPTAWTKQYSHCRSALNDVRKSNAFFVSGGAAIGKTSFLIRLISLTRILNAAISGHADNTLKTIYRTNPSRVLLIIDNIAGFDEKFSACSFRFLNNQGFIGQSEAPADVLRERFIEAIEGQEGLHTGLTVWNTLLTTTRLLSNLKAMGSHPLISQMAQLKKSLECGELDSMTEDEAERLRNTVSALHTTVECWIANRSKVADKPRDE